MHNGMKHQIVTTLDEWDALRQEWNELLASSRANTVFLCWEWLDSWMRVQATPPTLLVICIRDASGELLGVAPYYRTEYRLLKVFRYTILHVLGDSDSGAEYQTWIARASDEEAVFAQIVTALHALRSEWDLIWMPKLEAWVSTAEPVIGALRTGGYLVNTRGVEFSAVALPDSFDSFLSQMSSNRRQQLRRKIRAVLRNEKVQIRKVTSDAELETGLEILFDLHARRWNSLGKEGAFAHRPRKKAFYREFARKALSKGWLALYVLYDDGDPKAVQFGYVYSASFLQLQEGFDPDYLPGVGNALRARVIEDMIRLGVTEYDFLGEVSEHKRRWLANTRHGLDLLAARRCLKGIPILRCGIWPPGKYLQRISTDQRHND